MTEKTFRDMLPLTAEQRCSLETRFGECYYCTLDVPGGCAQLVGMKPNDTCRQIRTEALKVDEEYKKEHMKGKLMNKTEKTFRDLLQVNNRLTEEQLNTLKNETTCDSCFLDYRNNGTGKMCYRFVETGANGCYDTKAEALRLVNEYKKECTEEGILSQDIFERTLRSFRISHWEEYASDMENSHYAALKRISSLKGLVGKLSAQIDRRDSDWRIERSGFRERIAELEKSLRKSEDYIGEVLLPKIASLESHLAEHSPVQVYTKEEAERKRDAIILESVKKGYCVADTTGNNPPTNAFRITLFSEDLGCGTIEEIDNIFIDYTEPGEPQIGDLMMVDDDSPDPVAPIIVYGVDSDYIYDHMGNNLCRSECKPTGYCVNEDGRVVPISADRGQKKEIKHD